MKNILLVGLLFLMGCSVTVPHVVEYRLDPSVDSQKSKESSCREKSLKVGRVFASNTLMTKSMNYATEKYELFSYTESEWAISPSKAIGTALLKSIRASENFSYVSDYRSRSKTDLLLETHVDSFIQHFSNDNKSATVEITLSLTLLDQKSLKVSDSKVISKRVTTPTADAKGGVSAFNSALKEILLEANAWLAGSCR